MGSQGLRRRRKFEDFDLKNSDFLMKNRFEERKFAKIFARGGLQVQKQYKIPKILLWSPPQAENFGDLDFSGKFSPPCFSTSRNKGGNFPEEPM